MSDSPSTTQPLLYDLRVNIEPAAHRLSGEATIQQPVQPGFFLNKDLVVQQVLVDGQPVDFQRDPAQSLLSPGDTLVSWTGPAGSEVRVVYSGILQDGNLPKMLEVVSSIREEIIELAYYAVWYPRFIKIGAVAFCLEINLPVGYQAVTNGRLEQASAYRNEMGEERSSTRWVSVRPGFDIVIVAAPQLQTLIVAQGDAQIEFNYDRLPVDYVQTMGERLLVAMHHFRDWFGPCQNGHMARLIYAPRDAWGYARAPAIIVSEDRALEVINDPLGPIRDFRYAAHELGHFWWGIASMSTPDDWINEGLAEFSAYRMVEAIFGPDIARERVAEYRAHAAASQTDTPIAETASNSPDREVNRYDKVTLLMIATQERFGQEAINRFLSALYTRFSGKQKATTADFLEVLEICIGLEPRKFFEQRLLTSWKEISI